MASVNWFEDGVSSWVLAIWIRFDEGLRLETSPWDSLYGVQLQYKLSWVKPNYFCNIPPPPLRRIETYYFSSNVSMNWDQVPSGGRGAVSILLAIMVRILYFKGYSALTYITHPWSQLFALSVISVVRHFISNCENLAMLRSGYKPAFQWLLVKIARPPPFRDIKMFIPSSGTTWEVFLSLVFADFFVCGTIHGLHFLYWDCNGKNRNFSTGNWIRVTWKNLQFWKHRESSQRRNTWFEEIMDIFAVC